MKHSALIATFMALVACSSDKPAPIEPLPDLCRFTNPIGTGQDPWIVRHEGWYYYAESGGRSIDVFKSQRLSDPRRNGARVWTAPDTGWNATNVWAPELHFIDGRWYIYYTAGRSGPPYIHQRSGVLRSAGLDPQGVYQDLGQLDTGGDIGTRDDDVWSIDLTTGVVNGQRYAVWSGWEANDVTDRTPQHLYIAPMSDPMTISGPRVKISSPTETWERGTDLDLQEGPTFLHNGEHTFLIYSTRESWLPDYRLGQLRLASGADPLQPASWVKSGPVFMQANGVHGPGHASFVQSPDATEWWIMYHAKVSTAPGWDRRIRAQKFTWNADGSPNFGAPVGSGQSVTRPSGECE